MPNLSPSDPDYRHESGIFQRLNGAEPHIKFIAKINAHRKKETPVAKKFFFIVYSIFITPKKLRIRQNVITCIQTFEQ